MSVGWTHRRFSDILGQLRVDHELWLGDGVGVVEIFRLFGDLVVFIGKSPFGQRLLAYFSGLVLIFDGTIDHGDHFGADPFEVLFPLLDIFDLRLHSCKHIGYDISTVGKLDLGWDRKTYQSSEVELLYRFTVEFFYVDSLVVASMQREQNFCRLFFDDH